MVELSPNTWSDLQQLLSKLPNLHRDPKPLGNAREWALLCEQYDFQKKLIRIKGGNPLNRPEIPLKLVGEAAVAFTALNEIVNNLNENAAKRVQEDVSQEVLEEFSDLLGQSFPIAWQLASLGSNFSEHFISRISRVENMTHEMKEHEHRMHQQIVALEEKQASRIQEIDNAIAKSQDRLTAISKIERDANLLCASAGSAKEEAELAAQAAKKSALAFEISKSSDNFGEVAWESNKSARNWLIASGVALLGLGALAVAALMHYGPFALSLDEGGKLQKLSTADELGTIIGRILVFGVSATIVSVCIKNFFAQRHNFTVNQHRKIALESYESVVAGTQNDHVRDTLLIQVGSCMFSHQDSGYSKNTEKGNVTDSAALGFLAGGISKSSQ